MDAIAARLGADVVHGIANASRASLDDRVLPRDAQTEDVHERVATVAFVEDDLPANRRDPDAVAIPADARHDATQDSARSGLLDRAEPQRVEQRDRPGAHGEDVADDAADAGGGPLVRLDERRVVVRFDLEHGGQAVADVHRPGILTRPLQHAWPFGRQGSQVHAGTLVAAVLRPHHREQPQLGQIRFAAHQLDDPRVLIRRQAMPREQAGIDGRHLVTACSRPRSASVAITDSNRTRPSALPTTRSQARSGCGIKPTTFRPSLQRPAIW